VGRVRPRRSAISLTPSLRGPLARTFVMRAARSTDWIIGRRVGLLSLFDIVGARQGTELRLRAEGPDASSAVAALSALVVELTD